MKHGALQIQLRFLTLALWRPYVMENGLRGQKM
jgi:hypothetical protein